MLAQMLVLSSILRARVSLDQSQQVEMIDQLVNIGKSRSYLYLPALKLIVAHFLTDSTLLEEVVAKTAFKMEAVTIDSLFLFLSYSLRASLSASRASWDFLFLIACL